MIDESFDHVFVTGPAGTGKTTLLQRFVDETEKTVVVAAPTGVAALAVGGQTLHSLFRLPPALIREGDIGFCPRPTLEMLRLIDTLVIDEISMVRADVLDGVDRRLRQAKRSSRPFGGAQLLMFGDLFQLAPIVSRDESDEFRREGWKSPWFFEAKVWQETAFRTVSLETIHRQTDAEFQRVLLALRNGTIDADMAQMLNERGQIPPDSPDVVTLAALNSTVREINSSRLKALKGKARQIRAQIDGDFPGPSQYPADDPLTLKAGAQVIFLRNDSPNDGARWVNGTVGVIASFSSSSEEPDSIVVEVDGDQVEVERVSWTRIKYAKHPVTNEPVREEVGQFTQFPLRLAWAVTIHKAQGKTLDEAMIDLGPRAFAAGQTYVAFSRLTSLDGLHLARPLKPADIIVDPDVKRFFETASNEAGALW